MHGAWCEQENLCDGCGRCLNCYGCDCCDYCHGTGKYSIDGAVNECECRAEAMGGSDADA